MKRALTIFTIVITAFIVLLLALLAFTQTSVFRDYVRGQVEQQVNDRINGKLEIGSLHGSFFNDLEVRDLRLTMQQDTLLTFRRLYLAYNLWPLLASTIEIGAIELGQPAVYLWRHDQKWNFQQLFPAQPDTTPDTTAQPFDWRVVLGRAHISDGALTISMADSIEPTRIADLQLHTALQYAADSMRLDLRHFSFNSSQPAFRLDTLKGSLSLRDSLLDLRGWRFVSAANKAVFSGNTETENYHGNLRLATRPLRAAEFSFVLPDLQLKAQPTLQLKADSRADSLLLAADLNWQGQHIYLDARLTALQQWLEEDGQRAYALSLRLEKFRLRDWLAGDMPRLILNGALGLNGNGLDPQTARASLRAGLTNSRFEKYAINQAQLEGDWQAGNARIEGGITTPVGSVKGSGSVSEFFEKPLYGLDVRLRNLDLAGITGNDTLNSDLNFTMRARGSGNSPENLDASAEIFMNRSRMDTLWLDSLYTIAHLRRNQLTLDTLMLNTAEMKAQGSGAFNLKTKAMTASALLTPGNLKITRKIIGADSLSAAGQLMVNASGRTDSLWLDTQARLSALRFNDLAADSIRQTGRFFLGDTLSGETQLAASGLGFQDRQVDRLAGDLRFAGRTAHLALDVQYSDSIRADVAASVHGDSLLFVDLERLQLQLYKELWQLKHAPARFTIAADTMFSVDSLHWSNRSGAEIRLAGVYRPIGDLDLRLFINDLSLQRMSQLSPRPLGTRGLLDLQARLAGTLQKPLLKGRVTLHDGGYETFSFNALKARFDIGEEQRFNLEGAFMPVQNDSVTLSLELPLNFAAADSASVISRDEPFRMRLYAGRFSMRYVEEMTPWLKKGKGSLAFDISASNTLNDPKVDGFFRVNSAAVEVPRYGLNYRKIDMDLRLNEKGIDLSQLKIDQEKGGLKISGNVQFDEGIFSGRLSRLKLDVNADRFWLVRHPDYEAQISGKVNASGTAEQPQFSGAVTVNRSRFFLPALTGKRPGASTDDLNTPKLVRAINRQEEGQASPTQKITPDTTRQESVFWKKTRGTLQLSIPRNTWVKSPDMRLEIAGSLELVKNGPTPELFGPIEIMRGHYDLLGRRFNIREGRLIFQGGGEYNPEVTLKADYSFRTAEREKKLLILEVEGRVNQPQLSFTMEGRNITEGDAMAYLLFGRSLSELSYGQQSQLAGTSSGGEGNLARGLATGLISQQIAQTVGQELNLDYFEIRSQGNLQGAAFVVGKYITNDLFMSYERSVGSIDEDDVADQKVTLEYELTRWLFLQLIEGDSRESGFDLIFRQEWE